MLPIKRPLLVGLLLGVSTSAWAQVPGADHVVIVGIDGLSPDGLRRAKTPALDRWMEQGAYTLRGRAVMPTDSSPNWASLISGAGPEQHGVTSNHWEPGKYEIAPTAVGPGGIFPTIFSVLRAQRPSAVTACFHDWDGLARLLEKGAPTVVEALDGAEKTVERAVDYFKEKRPHFTLIHLDHVDRAGHEHGYGTPRYYEAVEEADRLIGRLTAGLREAGMLERTVVLVVSDHGGKGKEHGGVSLEEIEVPWIISGPGIRAGKEIQSPVNIYDTAATIAYIFGLSPPAAWIARPVSEAFESGAPAPQAGAASTARSVEKARSGR